MTQGRRTRQITRGCSVVDHSTARFAHRLKMGILCFCWGQPDFCGSTFSFFLIRLNSLLRFFSPPTSSLLKIHPLFLAWFTVSNLRCGSSSTSDATREKVGLALLKKKCIKLPHCLGPIATLSVLNCLFWSSTLNGDGVLCGVSTFMCNQKEFETSRQTMGLLVIYFLYFLYAT